MGCPYKNRNQCTGGYYPQDCIDNKHSMSYCLYNNQDNCRGCNFFPTNETWHYCNDCGECIYDRHRFCPICGSRQ